MVKVTSVKRILFLVVALLLCATVVFAACTNGNFQPLKDKPSGLTPESNGGVAVRYGDWLYYINGYTSDASADNTYSNDVVDSPRIGSVVRIKLAEIEKLFEISEDDLDEDEDYKSVADKIAAAVRGDVTGVTGAETVVPKIYISSNTAETRLTGLYIFDDRIYITTPNDELTAGGNPRTNELVLMSFDLNGANPKVHFNFGGSDGQIWLGKVDGKVVATYFISNKLYHLDVAAGKETQITYANASSYDIETINDVSSVTWDLQGEGGNVFFINSVGEICKLPLGTASYEVVVANEVKKSENDSIETTYEYKIKNVNNGQVYYTKKDDVETETVLYWADSDHSDVENRQVALKSDKDNAVGWRDGMVVYPISTTTGYYGLNIIKSVDGTEQTVVLPREDYEETIAIVRIVGDTLYYSVSNVYYTLNLQKVLDNADEPVEDIAVAYEITAYAYNPASSTGWAIPDYVNVETSDGVVHYVITAASSGVTVVKFDPEEKKNSETSVALTLRAAPTEE
ncbi:MAG: hypothetical protein J1F65_03195 [Clostridiales bacterium]|nr:hypothetical protein [Clostridiales bacterium]